MSALLLTLETVPVILGTGTHSPKLWAYSLSVDPQRRLSGADTNGNLDKVSQLPIQSRLTLCRFVHCTGPQPVPYQAALQLVYFFPQLQL